MSDFTKSISLVAVLEKEISFYNLLKKYVVQIPVFQREYAQGRQTSLAVNVRTSFVQSLYRTVQTKSVLNLNMIYAKVKVATGEGSCERTDERTTISIVDGQQRLTTLFLFYLYHLKSDKVKMLKHFTYSGRDSAKIFCEKLIEDRDFWKHEPESCEQTEYLLTQSDKIKKRHWFLPIWERDPSIVGMLTVLDEIHTQWSLLSEGKRRSFYSRLESGVILSLVGVHDEYDTYLKMNARGKRLSSFEILKAYLDKKVPKNSTWKTEIDKTWLDLIWKEVGKSVSDTTQTEKCNCVLFRLTLTLLLIHYIVRQDNETAADKKELISKTRKAIENSEYVLSENDLEELTKGNCFSFLEKGFARILSVSKKASWCSEDVNTWWSPLWEEKETESQSEFNLFSLLSSSPFTYEGDALLYAYVLSEDVPGFFLKSTDWWRMVHNILTNQSIKDEETLVRALRRLQTFHNVKDFETLILELRRTGTETFAQMQCAEEATKLGLLYENEDKEIWRKLISAAESRPWFEGRISFLFTQMKTPFNTEEFNSLLGYYDGKFGYSYRDSTRAEKRTTWIKEVLPRLEVAHRQNSALWTDRRWDIYFELLENDAKLKEFLYGEWQKQLFRLDGYEPVTSLWMEYLGEKYANRAFSGTSSRDGSGAIMSIRNKDGKILAYVGANVSGAICIDDSVAWWYETFDRLRDVARIFRWRHYDGEPWIEFYLDNVTDCKPEGLIVRLCGTSRRVQVGVDSIDEKERKTLSDKGIMINDLEKGEWWAPFDEECRVWQDDELEELVNVLKSETVEEILRGLRKSPESGGAPAQA